MFEERIVVCLNSDGKPCGRITEAEAVRLDAAGRGRIVRSRTGRMRLMLAAVPEIVVAQNYRGWRGGSNTTRRVPVRRGGVAVTQPLTEHRALVFE